MRVLHVSTYDCHGGAARAAYRLFVSLKGECEGRLVTKERRSRDPAVFLLPPRRKSFLQKKIYQAGCLFRNLSGRVQVPPGFSVPEEDFFSADLIGAVQAFRPHIVHLHWLCNGFLSIEELARIRRPLIWTLHDSWPFTGGCHVPGDCTAYRQQCGNCPVLASGRSDDLSRSLFYRKRQIYSGLDLTLVSPSRWMADCARQSSLFEGKNIEVIPHGLDLSVFRPVDRVVARQALGLPEDEIIILFGGMSSTIDPNKGYDLLVEALKAISDRHWLSRVRLLIFGAGEDERIEVSLPVREQHLGYLDDDVSLVMAYSAADVMVVPSRREAFGQTATEALGCDTPVVCFRTSGLVDIVDHMQNGYLARPFDPLDLASGILWATSHDGQGYLRTKARQSAINKFAQSASVARHMDTYVKLHDKMAHNP